MNAIEPVQMPSAYAKLAELGDCIIHTGATAGNGYGVISINGKMKYAHRHAWEIANGMQVPDGLVVAHVCDVPSCINPNHLVAMTQKENLRDMVCKGRSAKGEKHGSRTKPGSRAKGESVASSKLTAELVKAIRSEYQAGKAGYKSKTSLTGIADQYGIAFQTVSKIVNRVTWRHV